jgi:hypothetical protein
MAAFGGVAERGSVDDATLDGTSSYDRLDSTAQ